MNRSSLFSIAGLAVVSVAVAFTQAPQDKQPAKPTAPPAGEAPQLPPGWTEADMQACMEAATPGEMHAHLAEGIGVWNGKSTMWMAPGAPPMHSECVSTVTPMMDGRYIKCEIEGDMPGMGPFKGMGIYGYDNVSQKFQCTWIDNCSTGQMIGTGALSSDDKAMTWTFSYHCPVTKKVTTMREIERITGKDTRVMEMHGVDPKSGKEYKMMEIALTRQPGSAAAATAR